MAKRNNTTTAKPNKRNPVLGFGNPKVTYKTLPWQRIGAKW